MTMLLMRSMAFGKRLMGSWGLIMVHSKECEPKKIEGSL